MYRYIHPRLLLPMTKLDVDARSLLYVINTYFAFLNGPVIWIFFIRPSTFPRVCGRYVFCTTSLRDGANLFGVHKFCALRIFSCIFSWVFSFCSHNDSLQYCHLGSHSRSGSDSIGDGSSSDADGSSSASFLGVNFSSCRFVNFCQADD